MSGYGLGFPEFSHVPYPPADMLPVIDRAQKIADKTSTKRTDWHPLVAERLGCIAREATLLAELTTLPGFGKAQFTLRQLVDDQEAIWRMRQRRAGLPEEMPSPLNAISSLLEEAVYDSMMDGSSR